MAETVTAAICYDFDGTLSPGNMQEYGFFSRLGKAAQHFWQDADRLLAEGRVDFVLPADHSAGGRLENTISALIDRIAAGENVRRCAAGNAPGD